MDTQTKASAIAALQSLFIVSFSSDHLSGFRVPRPTFECYTSHTSAD
jgi:hypothetical protein